MTRLLTATTLLLLLSVAPTFARDDSRCERQSQDAEWLRRENQQLRQENAYLRQRQSGSYAPYRYGSQHQLSRQLDEMNRLKRSWENLKR